MDANRKQAMVPEGAIAARPGRDRARAGGARPASGSWSSCPARRASCSRCGRRRWRPSRCGRCWTRATPLRGYTMRMFGVPESEIAKSLREIEARRGRRSARSRSPPACGAGRSRSTSATATRRRRSPRRSARACCERHRRETFSLDGETIDAQVATLLLGHRLGLAESCSGGLMAARITDLPGASEYFAGGVVAYSNEAKAELLGRRPGADRGARARSRPRSPRRWRSGRWSASTPTSPSRSPASPAPTAAARRSRSATSASTPGSPTGPAIARDPVIPGGRADIRERSALVGMHLLRMLLGERRAAALERFRARDLTLSRAR